MCQLYFGHHLKNQDFFLFQFFYKTFAMEVWSPHRPRWTPRCPQGLWLGLFRVQSYCDLIQIKYILKAWWWRWHLKFNHHISMIFFFLDKNMVATWTLVQAKSTPINVLAKTYVTQTFLNENWKKTLITKVVIKIQAPHFYGLDFFFSTIKFWLAYGVRPKSNQLYLSLELHGD